jgi:hypothetical protein
VKEEKEERLEGQEKESDMEPVGADGESGVVSSRLRNRVLSRISSSAHLSLYTVLRRSRPTGTLKETFPQQSIVASQGSCPS